MLDNDGKEVVITGLGVIAAAGAGKKAFWSGITSGKVPVIEVTVPPANGFPKRSFYQVPDYKREDPKASETFNLAMFACREALADAGFDPSAEDLAFYFGSGIGNLELIESTVTDYPKTPRAFGSISGDLASKIGAKAGNRHISCECTSGLAALIAATDDIEAGKITKALVCGADAWSFVVQGMFNRGNVLGNGSAKPLTSDSEGLILGAGSAALLIEEKGIAVEKGRNPIASILETSMNVDIFSPVTSEPGGGRLADCIKSTFVKSKQEEVAVLLSHASGLPLADASEVAAINQALGENPAVNVLNIKHYVGHTVGASTLITLIAGILAKAHGAIPPFITYQGPWEKFPEKGKVLSVGYGIGGVNAAALLEII